MVKDKRFEKIREGIYQELLKANHHFQIFWKIRAASDDIARATRGHLTFFFFTMWANSERFCLAINNVLENRKYRKSTYNFYKLFDYVRNHPELSNIFSKKEIDKMRNTISSHGDLIKRLHKVRDKYIAHKEITPEHLKEEITYEREEGKELLVTLNSIFQKLSIKYDDKPYAFDVVPSLNVEAVLRSLTEHYEFFTIKYWEDKDSFPNMRPIDIVQSLRNSLKKKSTSHTIRSNLDH